MDERLVVIADFPTREEAELVVGRLRAEGIDAIGRFDDAGHTLPQLAGLAHGGTSVLVPTSQLHLARRVLRASPVPVAAAGPGDRGGPAASDGTAALDDEPPPRTMANHRRAIGLTLIFLIWGLPLLMPLLDSIFGLR
jgi:hypothetical protein